MKNKTVALLGVLGAVVGFAAGGLQGCGSSSSGGALTPAQRNDLCKKICDKLVMCTPELAPFAAMCMSGCTNPPDAGSNSQGSACAADSANIDKANACFAKSCTEYTACLSSICPTTGGTGGTNGGGTGGSLGTGTGGRAGGSGGASAGSGGTAGGTGGVGVDGGSTAGCDDCAKFEKCCTAVLTAADAGDPQTCMATSACAMATGTMRDNLNMACQMALPTLAAVPNAPDVCK